MNNILLNYILKSFLKKFFYVVLIAYCFGVILSLFEEIEFFKNSETSIFLPLTLTIIFIPSLILKILPFIIFVSSMWFIVQIRNNKDFLMLKVFGYSNLKIFFLLAFTSFLLGWVILICVNPFTSAMSKYYEITKSNYSKDIEHLITFNNNGLWIKENFDKKNRVIYAQKPEGTDLINLEIFHYDSNSKLIEKIVSKKADITNNEWILNDVKIFKSINEILEVKQFNEYNIQSNYNYEKINSLFRNLDTMSFLDLIFNYEKLLINGYNQNFLKKSFHTFLSMPFFLLLMTALAAILTMNTLNRLTNFRYIVVAIIACVTIFYIKDLSLALGQTDRIPLIISIWSPVIILSLFTFTGVLQINEK